MSPMSGATAAPPSSLGMLAGPDAVPADGQQQLAEMMGQMRELAAQVNELVQSNPSLAQEGQQINAIIKQMIVKAARMAPQQGPSGAEVPPTA